MGGKEKKKNLQDHQSVSNVEDTQTLWGNLTRAKRRELFTRCASAGLTTKLPSPKSAREFVHTNTKTVNFSTPKIMSMSVPVTGKDNIPEFIRK